MPWDSQILVRLNASPLEMLDTANKQHHSRIEITTKSMIDHMLSEKVWFFKVFIHVIPGAWSRSKCCPSSMRIPSWLRNSHCRERQSHHRLISPYFPPYDGFFYIESVPGCIFSTQTRALTSAPKINCCEMTCWKRNQNISRHLATCQLKLLEQCGSAVYHRVHKD